MIFGKAGSRRTVFVVVLIGLIIIGAFLFYVWHETQNENENQGETVIAQKAVGGYEVDGNMIKNEKYGLTLEAPKGWNIKNYDEGGVGMFSPEIDVNNFMKSAREKGACLVGLTIEDTSGVADGFDSLAENVRDLINEVKKGVNNGYGIVSVNGKDGLKKITIKDKETKHILVQIPLNNVIVTLDSSIIYSASCAGYFDDVIKTLWIR
jgi:hypothetical protein